MHIAVCRFPRISLPRTGVKIGSAAAHFHGFGVARQGPWVTSVNNGKMKGRGCSTPRPLTASRSVRQLAWLTALMHCPWFLKPNSLKPPFSHACLSSGVPVGGDSEPRP
jgi:hypothetical protein